jgi:pimeloyl-ACP methyl ester carboxylesterase
VRLETATFNGDPARAAIVLLHEGLGSVSLWRDVPQRLHERTGRTIVAYSRRGYGRSDALEGKREPAFMHDEAMRVLPGLLRALALERPILFGHSDGASIALIYGGAFPDGITALILEAPHVFVEDVSLRSIAAAREAFRTTDLRAKLARHHADVDGAFYGWNDVWLDPRFSDWNIEAYAARVRAPVLLIQGANDEYGTTAQLDAIARRAPRVETAVLPGAGHTAHRDAAEAVLDRIAAFTDPL